MGRETFGSYKKNNATFCHVFFHLPQTLNSAELWLFVWWGNPITLSPCEENMFGSCQTNTTTRAESSKTLAAKNLGVL